MKFGKKLRATVQQSDEEWRPMFMSYKDLKKRIAPREAETDSRDSDSKSPSTAEVEGGCGGLEESELDSRAEASTVVPVRGGERGGDVASVQVAERTHGEFFACFRHEVEKVNEFFLDKQEDYIIEHRQLAARVGEILVPGRATRLEVHRLRQRLTDFHGQLVLLENFSTVNYTGFRKILKKHDKKTGLNMRTVYLKTVLLTPFFVSNTVRKLVLDTEAQLAEIATIRKFRRSSSAAHALHLDEPPAPPQPSAPPPPPPPPPTPPPYAPLQPDARPETPSAAQFTRAALVAAGRAAADVPRPHAFISPRSALWWLYVEARAYGNAVRAARLAGGTAERTSVPSPSPPPPQALAGLVDAVSADELGLHPGFLQLVTQPSNYCIAGDETFSMGFFALPPPATLQVFRARRDGAFITKNLRGRVRLRVFDNVVHGSATTSPSEHELESEAPWQANDFCVEEVRSGVTNGPWPAVTCAGDGTRHVEWVPAGACAIFYVCAPALGAEDLSRYALQPLTHPFYRAVCSGGQTQSFARIVC